MNRVLVLGAGGIVGQYMRLAVPDRIKPIWYRRDWDYLNKGFDLTDYEYIPNLIQSEKPTIVLNLSGENSVDIVEQYPDNYRAINVDAVRSLTAECANLSVPFVQVSTQAVFGGKNAPYYSLRVKDCQAVNYYGKQKWEAEEITLSYHKGFVVRLTFVLGVNIVAGTRQNPLEQFVLGKYHEQVCDKYFSVSFADDVAEDLWSLINNLLHVNSYPVDKIYHIGIPYCVSRYSLAKKVHQWMAHTEPKPVVHDLKFSHLAPRPDSTVWGNDVLGSYRYGSNLEEYVDNKLHQFIRQYRKRVDMELQERAHDIALFLQMNYEEVWNRLSQGFGHNHALVAEDYRRANIHTDAELLEWYRKTESYIWELSVYHADTGFNYKGMMEGIADHLETQQKDKVLVLGDGIGDMTIYLLNREFDAYYHDLAFSRTAHFANFRHYKMTANQALPIHMSFQWEPPASVKENEFDAIVACDFFEHLINVEDWLQFAYRSLNSGGLFMAQNAFGIGDEEHGNTIPMHLSRNNHYEQDWDKACSNVGFKQISSNWYQKGES